MESTSYVLSFRMVFFYLVTMCWIFDINLCDNSIKFNQSWRVPGTSYVFFFRMVFFYLVTTGYFFDISLCENSISQSKSERQTSTI